MQREVQVLRGLPKHPNLVGYVDDFLDAQDRVCVVLEYCDGGSLEDFLRTYPKGRMPEEGARKVIAQLVSGLGFLHTKCGIVHRDIKLENILLKRKSWDGKSVADFEFKIADMGLAKHNVGTTLRQTICGTPMYMAPELLLEQAYSAKADIWSLGVLTFVLVAGRYPFECHTKQELLWKVRRGEFRFPSDLKVSQECQDFVRACLQNDQAKRASLNEISKHYFIKLRRNLTFGPARAP